MLACPPTAAQTRQVSFFLFRMPARCGSALSRRLTRWVLPWRHAQWIALRPLPSWVGNGARWSGGDMGGGGGGYEMGGGEKR